MGSKSWIYDMILYIYALSLLFYFSDTVSQNRSAKRMGTGLLVFVWLLQTVYIILRLIQHRYMPMLNLFEFLFFFSWLLVTLSLVLNRFYRVELLVFALNVIGFTVLALNVFTDPGVSLQQSQRMQDLLLAHVVLAVCSYAAFTIAAVFSGMYLFLHRSLKHKKWYAIMKRMPSLETIDRYTLYWTTAGTPLLVLSLCLAAVWILLGGAEVEALFDPKMLGTLLVLGAYSHYFMLRTLFRAAGIRLAVWSLSSYALLLANWLASSGLSLYHGL